MPRLRKPRAGSEWTGRGAPKPFSLDSSASWERKCMRDIARWQSIGRNGSMLMACIDSASIAVIDMSEQACHILLHNSLPFPDTPQNFPCSTL